MLTGIAFDRQNDLGLPGLPWLLMIALGCACAAVMLALSRSREFKEVAPV
jgi:hypothetical protein